MYANVVNLVDPSGKIPCSQLALEDQLDVGCVATFTSTASDIVKFYDDQDSATGEIPNPRFDAAQKQTIREAAMMVGNALAREINRQIFLEHRGKIQECAGPVDYEYLVFHPPTRVNGREAFLQVYGGPVTFTRRSFGCINCLGQTIGAREIWIFSNATANNVIGNHKFIIHELGHAFDNAAHRTPRDNLLIAWNADPNFPRRDPDNVDLRGYHGTRFGWQQSNETYHYEEFADMFIGWVYNKWQERGGVLTDAGRTRADFMDDNIWSWIRLARGNR